MAPCRSHHHLFAACCLLLRGAAAQLNPSQAGSSVDGPEDVPRSRAVPPERIFRRTAYLYSAATLALMPLVAPTQVGHWLDVLRLPRQLQEPVLAACTALHALRSRHTLACLISHEIITDISADVMAQTVAARSAGGPMEVDWRRVPRSALSSLASDDIPFLFWSRALWVASERALAALRTSELPPKLVGFLSHPGVVTVAKTAITQIVYETTSTSAYLALQATPRALLCHFRSAVAPSACTPIRSQTTRFSLDGEPTQLPPVSCSLCPAQLPHPRMRYRELPCLRLTGAAPRRRHARSRQGAAQQAFRCVA